VTYMDSKSDRLSLRAFPVPTHVLVVSLIGDVTAYLDLLESLLFLTVLVGFTPEKSQSTLCTCKMTSARLLHIQPYETYPGTC